jgi:hypothetical protein
MVKRFAFRRRLIAVLTAAGLAVALGVAMPVTASANDGPTGFWYGTDSGGTGDASTPTGSAPFANPFGLGGHYGGYVGEIGGWQVSLGEGFHDYWNADAAADAEEDSDLGDGVGTTGYWMLGGPAEDTALSAESWGFEQGQDAVTAWADSGSDLGLVWMDVESGEGWYGSGSAETNRDVFNGFFDAVQDSGLWVGVYSSPGFWADTMGTGTYSQIPHTYEWTSEYEYTISSDSTGTTGPYQWCSRSDSSLCAGFFGGTECALMWQWTSTAKGVDSPGDVDQIDSNELGASGCI